MLSLCVGRMHQLRRHMALLGHPVVGDSRYTYGYAQRHPDAPIRLPPRQAQQAKAHPFGVCSDHPYHTPDSVHIHEHEFWASSSSGASCLDPKGSYRAEVKQTELVSSSNALSAQSAHMPPLSPSEAQQDLQATLAQPASEQHLLHTRQVEASFTAPGRLGAQTAASGNAGTASGNTRAAPSTQLLAPPPTLGQQQSQSASVVQSVSTGAAQITQVPARASTLAQQHPERQMAVAQEVAELRRPSQVAAVQPAASSMHQPNATQHIDPRFIDLSIIAQARMMRAAPHYTDTLSAHVADQQGPSEQRASMELPAELQHVLCLWAVALMLPHPVTRAAMQLSIPDPDVFEKMRAAELQLAWRLRQQTSQ